MIKISSFKQELLCIALTVLFINLYLVYTEPRESLFLVLSIYFIFKIINKEKGTYRNIENKRVNIFKISTIMITYLMFQVFLFLSTSEIKLSIEKNYANRDEKAILLIYEGEDDKYNLENQIRNIKSYGGIIDKINATFTLNKYKRSYYDIGKSDYRKKAMLVKEGLQNIMPIEDYEVHLGFLSDNKYIDETMMDIVSSGFSEVIVVPVFIKRDESHEQIKKKIDKMKLFNEDISIKYIEGFEASGNLVNCYMEKIEGQLNKENISSTGVILIGSGDDPIETELMFRSKLEDYLNKFLNIEKNKIKKTWISNDSTGYINQIKNTLELGISDLIIIYTEPGITNLENNELYKSILNKISFPEGVKIKIIDGFLTEDYFIEEIKSKIEVLELMQSE